MAYDRFMIAPFNSGLEKDLKPFLIPEDAFDVMENAYVWRGTVRKRVGSEWMGPTQFNTRLRIAVRRTDTGALILTDGTGAVAAAAVKVVPGTVKQVGQSFSIGDLIFTVTSSAAGDQPMAVFDIVNDPSPYPLASGTFNLATGAFSFANAAPNTQVYFYPSQPVMGITQFQDKTDIANQKSFAFDTQFVYQFINGAWERLVNAAPLTTPVWTGTDYDFFWCENWNSALIENVALYITNFSTADGMYYWNGTDFTAFIPYFNPGGGAPQTGPFVKTALMIVTFHGRLLLLNTIEDNGAGVLSTHPTRCRYSSMGSPLTNTAWYEQNKFDTVGPNRHYGTGAAFIDAPTKEAILSAAILKNRLIVFFESSTYEIIYTGNAMEPFYWQNLNIERGSIGTFSSVVFDRSIITIGQTGVHICNGVNVERLDSKIPDDVFTIRSEPHGPERIAGVRDFNAEMIYWAVPVTYAQAVAQTYPTRILAYNYKNNTFAWFDDSFTAFGYFEQQTGYTWNSTNLTWEVSDFSWPDGEQASHSKRVLAGNQQGWVFKINHNISRNAPSLQITTMGNWVGQTLQVRIVNHNLQVGEWIYIEGADPIFSLLGAPALTIFQVLTIDVGDPNLITLNAVTNFNGGYLAGATAARVSKINILTKQFNPYNEQGKNVYLAKVDFNVDRTNSGGLHVNYFPSSSYLSMNNQDTGRNINLGTLNLDTSPYLGGIGSELDIPLEQYQNRLWRPVYLATEGETIQLQIYHSKVDLGLRNTALAPFSLNAMVLYTMPISRLQ